ncbi:ubiquinol oxidase subunit II [Sphingosinicellaceae bacterium]|nr:ubiquinol oxidase subunit II [Sphingosinicellaceae bacterium]
MRAALGVAASWFLTGCTPGVLDPVGPVGSAEKTILFNALAIMLAIVVPTILATWGVAWWFRSSNTRARRLPDWAFSGRIELVVWSIPLLTITFLGGVIWIGAHQLDPYRPLAGTQPPLYVEVVSLDWKWLFIYPGQGIAAVNQLVIPAGRPVHFRLTSASVMNAFFVPRMGSMIYTMNGMATQLSLQADKPGVFAGLSSHYSGDNFSDMAFNVRAVPPAAFEAWIARVRRGGPVLDTASYLALTRQGTARPFTYSAAAPRLFDTVVLHTQGPGPVGKAEKPAEISPRNAQ